MRAFLGKSRKLAISGKAFSGVLVDEGDNGLVRGRQTGLLRLDCVSSSVPPRTLDLETQFENGVEMIVSAVLNR